MSDSPRNVIVTGAGSGVGRATALRLAAAGDRVVLAGRTIATLQATADAVAAQAPASPPARTVATDVTDEAACRRLVEAAVDDIPHLHALINVAGHATLAEVESITGQSWRTTIDTNLTSVVMLTAAAWPIFQSQGAGVVVNISSSASIDPFPRFAMYAAAKAGVNMFTTATAREGEPLGIRVFGIAPGAIETPMLRGLFDEAAIPPASALSPDAVADAILARVDRPDDFTNGETEPLPSP